MATVILPPPQRRLPLVRFGAALALVCATWLLVSALLFERSAGGAISLLLCGGAALLLALLRLVAPRNRIWIGLAIAAVGLWPPVAVWLFPATAGPAAFFGTVAPAAGLVLLGWWLTAITPHRQAM